MIIKGHVTRGLRAPETCALLQPTTKSSLPPEADIAPTIITYDSSRTGEIDVHISNVTTRTLIIPPGAILCELQPVTIEDPPTEIAAEVSRLKDTIDVDATGLSEEERKLGLDVIFKYKDIFSQSDEDLGHTDMVRHRIEVDDVVPFKQRYRRIPPGMLDEIRTHLQQLLAAGVIRPSHSPWASNVVVARRKDGRLRLCIDYRQLNNRTIRDSYALPRIEELLDSLGGMKYFSVLDMKSGYYQVGIEEEHKQRTAFTVGPLGFFEYNRMPFGLSNAPATYQRLMERCLEGLHLKMCLVYLDDLIIFSRTYEEHIERLDKVLRRIQECGLKLAPKKCAFFKRKVKYVGFIISEDGIETDPDKVEKIKNWPVPSSPEDIRKFLGFAGYYRRFVENFSKIAKPLSELMPKSASKKNKTKSKSSDGVQWRWDTQQQEAFDELKTRLCSQPILGFPDYDLPFELHTDASAQGLGAVLYQKQGGHLRVIAYASRALGQSERNYSAHKLEYLCLKWAVSEKFHDYLYGHNFTVITDNNPLTYVLTSAKLDATGHRWLAALSSYNFSIHYRPGKANVDADTLSRMPSQEVEEITTESVSAICSLLHVSNLVESLSVTPDDIEEDIDLTDVKCADNAREWRRAQLKDPALADILMHMRNGTKPLRPKTSEDKEKALLVKNFGHFILKRGVLYRTSSVDGEKQEQLVLPTAYRRAALRSLHDNVGHPGRDRTVSLLKDRFYWPGLISDVEAHIRTCERCLRRKTPTNVKAPLVSIQTSAPLELVCMDFLTLEPSKGGQQHVLVVTDHFTRYAQAYPTKNMTAKTTAEAFFNNFVVHYGLPKRIHSDQGANFTGLVMKELCQLLKIEKSRTTPYHPMGNGMCERFNRTLCNMLGTLDPDSKKNWKAYVGPLVHAYNCTRHETTAVSPFFLMFGRHPRLPVDLAFGLDIEPDKSRSTLQYTKSMKERLKQAYDLASSAAAKSQTKQKTYYDRKARAATLEEGDRVLVKIVAFDGKHKLADKWEEDMYVILHQPNLSIPVFVVGKENGQGQKRTLHRNLLLPVDSLPSRQTPTPKPRRQQKTVSLESRPAATETSDDGSDDSGDEVMFSIPPLEVSVSTDSQVDSPAEDNTVSTEDGDQEDVDTVVEEDGDVEEDIECVTHRSEAQLDVSLDDNIVKEAERHHSHTSPKRVTPVPRPRRSSRLRKQPRWMTGGEYVLSAVPSATDWMVRANYLSSLVTEGILEDQPQSISDAFLDLVTGKI
jgi:transposase InsO family protein